MRRRLLISMLAVAIAAVLALGIPLGFVLSRLQGDEAKQALHEDAFDVARQLAERFNGNGGPVDAAYASQLIDPLTGRYVQVWEGGRRIANAGVKPPRHDALPVQTVVNAPFRVSVTAPDSYLYGNLTEELTLVAGVALAAVGVAVILGLVYARRLVRPLDSRRISATVSPCSVSLCSRMCTSPCA